MKNSHCVMGCFSCYKFAGETARGAAGQARFDLREATARSACGRQGKASHSGSTLSQGAETLAGLRRCSGILKKMKMIIFDSINA